MPHRYTNQEHFFKVKILSLESKLWYPSDFANAYIKGEKSLLPYVPMSYMITPLKTRELLVLHKYVQWYQKMLDRLKTPSFNIHVKRFLKSKKKVEEGSQMYHRCSPCRLRRPEFPLITHGANLWACESLSCRCVPYLPQCEATPVLASRRSSLSLQQDNVLKSWLLNLLLNFLMD